MASLAGATEQKAQSSSSSGNPAAGRTRICVAGYAPGSSAFARAANVAVSLISRRSEVAKASPSPFCCAFPPFSTSYQSCNARSVCLSGCAGAPLPDLDPGRHRPLQRQVGVQGVAWRRRRVGQDPRPLWRREGREPPRVPALLGREPRRQLGVHWRRERPLRLQQKELHG